MRFVKVLFFILFLGSIFLIGNKAVMAAFNPNPYRPLCVGIQGKFTANSTWKGGYITVGCAGDDGGAAPNQSQACTGETQKVYPGERFRLTKCSCFGSDKGCLKIGKELTLLPLNSDNKKLIRVDRRIDEMPAFTNNSCRINKSGDLCGSNGQHITGFVKITCAVPTSTPTKTPTPTRNPSLTPTPGICPKPDTVTNVKVTCPNCFSANPSQAPLSRDISWKINGMELSANNPYIQIGTTKIPIKNGPTLDGSNTPYKVGNVYKQELEGTWHGVNGINGEEVSMLLSFIFEYTPGSFWKITEITASNGTQDSVFLKFGPKTKAGDDVKNTINEFYIDNVNPTEFVSEDGNATIHFENFAISAFLNGVGN